MPVGSAIHCRIGDPLIEGLAKAQAGKLLENTAQRIEAPVIVKERRSRCVAASFRPAAFRVHLDGIVVYARPGRQEVREAGLLLRRGERRIDIVNVQFFQCFIDIDELAFNSDTVQRAHDALSH